MRMKIPLLSNKPINGSITLPASKSISNRALFLAALSDRDIVLNNLALCDDTKAFEQVVKGQSKHIDIGAAGTAMRFATAFLAQRAGQWTLTGSERMKQRPINLLVEALRQLGAKIDYAEKEGFPPLTIEGVPLNGNSVSIDGSVSSQYISALMMLGASLPNGLQINLTGNCISHTYIEMTRQIMVDFGLSVSLSGNTINIRPAKPSIDSYTIENDWSAASYWYAMLAINGSGQIHLKGLSDKSYQGDANIHNLFCTHFGIDTKFIDDGILISLATNSNTDRMEYNFINEPDMAQTFTVCCCLTGKPFRFNGLQSLRIKETDRIAALIAELEKLGFLLQNPKDDVLIWDGAKTAVTGDVSIATYHDHRMAMSFAPVAFKRAITIENPEVVSKSYPNFWNDFKSIVHPL
jgi:3-phosphoshikimate 1-carboxyvinyltransferase